jgi:DHA2 family multidrug resistance protein
MSHFSLQMDALVVASTGFAQGLGTGLVFMPISVTAFGTVPAALRTDATGFFNLIRNVGVSVGISLMQTLYSRNVQVVHSRLSEGLTRDNPLVRPPYLTAPFSLNAPGGLQALDSEVTRQASMVAYIDVFHLMFMICLLLIPLVLLLRPQSVGAQTAAVAE